MNPSLLLLWVKKQGKLGSLAQVGNQSRTTSKLVGKLFRHHEIFLLFYKFSLFYKIFVVFNVLFQLIHWSLSEIFSTQWGFQINFTLLFCLNSLTSVPNKFTRLSCSSVLKTLLMYMLYYLFFILNFGKGAVETRQQLNTSNLIY